MLCLPLVLCYICKCCTLSTVCCMSESAVSLQVAASAMYMFTSISGKYDCLANVSLVRVLMPVPNWHRSALHSGICPGSCHCSCIPAVSTLPAEHHATQPCTTLHACWSNDSVNTLHSGRCWPSCSSESKTGHGEYLSYLGTGRGGRKEIA